MLYGQPENFKIGSRVAEVIHEIVSLEVLQELNFRKPGFSPPKPQNSSFQGSRSLYFSILVKVLLENVLTTGN